ncbi:MAG: NAD(P)-binding domain-containing protein [Candidatus Omnitrophota bacterium]
MKYLETTHKLIKTVSAIARRSKRLTGFCIGNTAKMHDKNLYFTPIRETSLMVTAGVIVYRPKEAAQITRAIDGKVDYILVDAEKRIPGVTTTKNDWADLEQTVRAVIRKSKLWIYKSNDLSTEAVDGLLIQLTMNSKYGIAGKKIAVIGAGNLGFKLAFKLMERGACVTITRRNKVALKTITQALNLIKSEYTKSSLNATTDNLQAVQGAEILIGTTPGIAAITPEMVESLAPGAIIIDAGKGTLSLQAIARAQQRGFEIYRLDISAAFEGLIHRLWATENVIEKKLGRRKFCGEIIVSGGLLGRKNEIIVDDIRHPGVVYGIADGQGDFIRDLSSSQCLRLKKISQEIIRLK